MLGRIIPPRIGMVKTHRCASQVAIVAGFRYHRLQRGLKFSLACGRPILPRDPQAPPYNRAECGHRRTSGGLFFFRAISVANNGYRVGFLAAVALVALRLVIGWHFFTAGLDKLDPEFSSAGFLRSANGPWADYFKSMAPQPHNWDQLITEPMPPAHKFEDDRRYWGNEGLQEEPYRAAKGDKYANGDRAVDDRIGHIPFPTPAYGPWASEVAEDWTRLVDRFKAVSGTTDEQREQADALLEKYLVRLGQYFEERRAVIAEYHHEVDRLDSMLESDARGELPYLDERITKKTGEVSSMPRSWVADVAAEEYTLAEELRSLTTDEQFESALFEKQIGKAFDPPTTLDTIDTVVMVTVFAVGGCLILGLFTRLASLVGAGFLLSVMATQPLWAEGVSQAAKLMFPYQGIEFVALLALAAIGAGRWAGLDGYFWRSDE